MKSYSSHQQSLDRNKSKPPIAPKPQLQSNASHPKLEIKRLATDSRQSIISSQQYSYPSAVLVKDEEIFDNFEVPIQNIFANVTPLPGYHESNKYPKQNGILPPLAKIEIKPSYLNQSNDFLNNARSGGRTMSGSAKNALMIEKIRGNINFEDGLIQKNEKCQQEYPSKEQYAKSVISINDTQSFISNNICISDNLSEKIIQPKYQSLSSDSSVHQPINADLYYKNNVPTEKTYYLCSCLPQDRCIHKEKCSVNSKKVLKEKLNQNNEPYPNGSSDGRVSFQILDSSIDELDTSSNKLKYNMGTSSVYVSSSQSAPCSPATKPSLQKSDAIDMEDYDYYKRLSRGISRATDNINIVSKARSEIAQEIWEALESTAAANHTPFFLDTPVITFTLPDLSCYTDEFRSFLEKDLIEMSTLVSLEAAGRLNWWAMIGASQRLWPLATTGDGNCLLHAASLGMWGFHDRLLTLRKALHEFLTKSQYRLPLWRRWRWQVAMQNRETGLVYSQEEWDAEWESVLRLASSAPRTAGQQTSSEHTFSSAPDLTLNQTSLSQGMSTNSDCCGPVYESLEEIHVLALAHVLKRPIIVVADVTLKDMNGDPLAPIPFGGIYLPLQCPPKECKRSPLLLTYDAAHFSALVAMEINDKDSKSSLPAVIPVSDCSHDLLPIQFLIDPGEDFTWEKDEFDPKVIQKLTLTTHDKKGLLSEYLDLAQVPIPSNYLEAAASFYGGPESGDSPESVASDQTDIDKKSSESSFDSDDSPPPIFDTGSLPPMVRGPKHLQTVVKSFGSISRSMSKKIKKNLSKLSRTGSFRKKNNFNKGFKKGSKKVRVATHQNFILAANIHIDQRQPYQIEMIENYLTTAKERFFRDATPVSSSNTLSSNSLVQKSSQPSNHTVTSSTAYESSLNGDSRDGGSQVDGYNNLAAMQCINSGCTLYGTAKTAYMCSTCFNRQKEQEEREYERQFSNDTSTLLKQNTDQDSALAEKDFQESPDLLAQCNGGAQYGAGKSKFYASLDEHSVKNATLIPTTQSLSGMKDKTLFLSNSTFYNDIPSYNLNKDLKREPTSRSRGSSYDSVSIRSSPNLNDATPKNRQMLEKSSFKGTMRDSLGPIRDTLAPIRDSLAPICIDEVRLQLGNTPKSKTSLRASLNGRGGGTRTSDGVIFPEDLSSKNCQTKGCHFFGNASTNFLCSKCHKKKESYSLDQIKFVHI